ncbi:hypothetical protein PAMA_000899 [Pampus argenteus]
MESSPQDLASDPGRSSSEPGTPVTETPPSLETLRGGEHLTPARRHSSSGSSSSSKGRAEDEDEDEDEDEEQLFGIFCCCFLKIYISHFKL